MSSNDPIVRPLITVIEKDGKILFLQEIPGMDLRIGPAIIKVVEIKMFYTR